MSSLPLYLTLTCVGLLVIAFGNGLFKGNLQALVGQMYDNKEFSAKRESGFQIFYMFINIGGFFAPFVAIGVRNWWLQVTQGFLDNTDQAARVVPPVPMPRASTMSPAKGLASRTSSRQLGLPRRARLVSASRRTCAISRRRLPRRLQHADSTMRSARPSWRCSSRWSSSWPTRRRCPDPSKKPRPAVSRTTPSKAEEIHQDRRSEIRQRHLRAVRRVRRRDLLLVSFHQNGYSLTYFARDYVNLDVININLGFTTIKGAEIFQSVNPFFVVTLTPLIMWFFGWLRKRNIEASTPMKIAIGMGIAATAYLFLMFFSFALPDKAALAGMKADQVQSILVTPWVMVGLYFILTVAELFISPLGLAFVSKVAPPHMQGLMQGFWLAATAVGNALLFVGGWLYMHTPMWATWCVFVAACGMSMLVMLSMVRWLERVTK